MAVGVVRMRGSVEGVEVVEKGLEYEVQLGRSMRWLEKWGRLRGRVVDGIVVGTGYVFQVIRVLGERIRMEGKGVELEVWA